MSHFLLNLARRGAGLPPEVPASPDRQPLFMPPAVPPAPEVHGKGTGAGPLKEPGRFSAAGNRRVASPEPVSHAVRHPGAGDDMDSAFSQQAPEPLKPRPSDPEVIRPEQRPPLPGAVQPGADPARPETNLPQTDAGAGPAFPQPVSPAGPMPARVYPSPEPALRNPAMEQAAPAPPARQRPAGKSGPQTADATDDPLRSTPSPPEAVKIEQLVQPAPPTWSPPVLNRPAALPREEPAERSVQVRIGTIEVGSQAAARPAPAPKMLQPTAASGFDAFHGRRNYVNWKDPY